MQIPIHLHLYSTDKEASNALRDACKLLKLHTGFLVRESDKAIIVDEIHHRFRAISGPDDVEAIHRLYGLRFIGWDSSDTVRLSDDQIAFLNSRVQPPK